MRKCSPILAALLIIFLGTAAWAKDTSGSPLQDDDTNVASGFWGGDDVSLQMNADGATVEFDCAEGTVLQPIKGDAKGEFTARGTYTPGQFGPIRKDNPPREMPAIYKGSISGDTMHLQVVVEKKELLPPFTLIKGKRGRVVRCH